MTVYGLGIGTYEAFDKAIDKVLDFVYLHGILEDKNGFDIVGVTRETYSDIHTHPFCVIDVDVILHNGNKENGVLFFWHDSDGREHGLIVSRTDEENMVYAQDCFDKRVHSL